MSCATARFSQAQGGGNNRQKVPDEEQLEMLAKYRSVIGYGGAFPPYEGLKRKILNAHTFEKAFELKPTKHHWGKGQQTI